VKLVGVDTDIANTIREVLRTDPPRLPPNIEGDTVTAGVIVSDDIQTTDGGNYPRVLTRDITKGPPAEPRDGDIWIATGVDANGTRWQFQYNAQSLSAYKWEFIGGLPMFLRQAADTTNTGGFSEGSDTSLRITLPLDGDYFVGAEGSVQTVLDSTRADIAVGVDTTLMVINWHRFTGSGGSQNIAGFSGTELFTGRATGNVALLKFQNASGDGTTVTLLFRKLRVTPVRIR
jgi:hypothetical protein